MKNTKKIPRTCPSIIRATDQWIANLLSPVKPPVKAPVKAK